jgi:hypothetical protein
MIKSVRLTNFKNFQDAELSLGKLTLLVGTNASGKSNLRDAFRFLHGIGRGYSLAEIFGEKWGEGGELQWHPGRNAGSAVSRHGEVCPGMPRGIHRVRRCGALSNRNRSRRERKSTSSVG